MEIFEKASSNLDTAASIEHLATMYNESSEPLANYVKGVVFPDPYIPVEVINYFYCLNIPLFVPTVDFLNIWSNGTSEQRSALYECRISDIDTRFNADLKVYSAFPQTIRYNCYYDLVDQLLLTNTLKVRQSMWEDNQVKTQQMKDVIFNLKSRFK